MSDDQGSPSLLNNLRGFRMQKKPTLSHASPTNCDGASSSPEQSPVQAQVARKRILPLIESDSEGDAAPSDTTTSGSSSIVTNGLSFEEKEAQLQKMVNAFPRKDTMYLQDRLIQFNWNADAAIKEMNKLEVVPILNNKRLAVTEVRPKAKKAKRRKIHDSDDSDFGGNSYNDTRVFDSDEDSDVEISDDLTPEKKRVLDFMQTATINELKLMTTCSQKKAEQIIEGRPFKGWIDLVQKLQSNKYLNTDLLNAAQQVLATRSNVRHLMKKCTNLSQQMERAVANGAGLIYQPKNLNSDMKLTGYQMVGLNWLAVMFAQGVNGILADEMGLGKTVQVIAFLAHLKEIGAAKGTHLIVVPASTLDNWRCEFERWCPDLDIFIYYGSAEERKMIRIDWARGGLSKYDVVLTTYSMVVSTPEERKMFRVTQMHYVVFDEAHMLKNMNSQRYENLIRIKAYNRILLTGTPLQNNLLELMSLLTFVMPSMFAGKTDDLKSLFQKNSKSNGAANEDLPAFEREQIAQAKKIMKPFVLRRLKRDVLKDLPTKTDHIMNLPLDSLQKQYYDDLVASFRNQTEEERIANNYSGITFMSDLRKLSNHPLLLRYHFKYEDLPKIAKILSKDPNYKETIVDRIVEDLACMSDFEIHRMSRNYPSISGFRLPDKLIVNSGKFQYLDKKLKELKEGGHRVLIFSQYVILLDVMEEYMKIRKHNFLRLDGSTPVAIRQELIDEFTEDKSIFVFLLSTRAGGLGINLTSADTVIIHDIDFNPYNDKQAEDRCHRMGQKNPVNVFRLIAKGTIEEGMWQMNQEKLKLEREITTNEEEDSVDLKSVVRLLSTALGIDNNKATNLVSPKKKS